MDLLGLAKMVLERGSGEPYQQIELGILPTWLSRLILDKTGWDLEHFKLVLATSEIHHIYKKHGNSQQEAKRGQEAVTPWHLALLPYIIFNPDLVLRKAAKKASHKEVIEIQKEFGGLFVCMLEVRRKRRHLAVMTLYKRVKKKD